MRTPTLRSEASDVFWLLQQLTSWLPTATLANHGFMVNGLDQEKLASGGTSRAERRFKQRICYLLGYYKKELEEKHESAYKGLEAQIDEERMSDPKLDEACKVILGTFT